MNDRVDFAPFKPTPKIVRRNEIGELPFLEVAPLAAGSEGIADDHVGSAALIETGNHVRADKTRPPGHQEHDDLGARVGGGRRRAARAASAVGSKRGIG